MVRIGFLKMGNIATSPMIELLLDERAEREDIEVKVLSSGANMGVEQSGNVAREMLELDPEMVFIISPNASTKGPTKAREIISESGLPTIIVSDGPKKLLNELKENEIGGIIVEADSMIGARREFLDPIEMAIFNADTMKVLSITGVYKLIYELIDDLIEKLKKKDELELPHLSIEREEALDAADFSNPYARAKAGAAYEMARRVSKITTAACFMVKDWEKYTSMCAEAHEFMRSAALLADEAREIEKYGNSVLRTPHYSDGSTLKKRKLIEKPE